MKSSILIKVKILYDRYKELELLLSDPKNIIDQMKFKNLSQEYVELEPIILVYRNYKNILNEIEDLNVLLKDNDQELSKLAEDSLKDVINNKNKLEQKIYNLLLPKDPYDSCNVFLEIRAGTGGNEASIFVGNLARMYMRYVELEKCKVEIMHESIGEHGGYKEIILRIVGKNVYSKLKFESGVHRVQRIPETESQGRVHTSASTVAILPEIKEIKDVFLNNNDLKIDTYRASGAGGQHVNRTDSAVRIKHIPTNIVVECQDERSQHKNKAKALLLLHSKILMLEQTKQKMKIAHDRKILVGSGDRSERIRTYNYPQGRITDHRINLTLYKLNEILDGNMNILINYLMIEHNANILISAT